MLKPQPTTIGIWALLIAQALDQRGVDGRALFLRAGIDINHPNAAQERYSVALMARAWEMAVEELNDPYFALSLVPLFQPSMYSATGIAMASSRNFHDALKRCLRYYQLTSDAAELNIAIGSDTIDLTLYIPDENRPVADEAIEAFCATLVALFRTMVKDDLAPVSVVFQHEKPVSHQPYIDYFGSPVSFGADKTEMQFKADILEQDLRFANPQLAAVVDEWSEQYLSSFKVDLVSTRIKEFIVRSLALGEVDQASAAKELDMSTRSLQRKLNMEGTSYSQLLDECRHQLALKYIQQVQIPISEIAYLLGFSDQSNFTRSFKRWTDSTPQKFREGLH